MQHLLSQNESTEAKRLSLALEKCDAMVKVLKAKVHAHRQPAAVEPLREYMDQDHPDFNENKSPYNMRGVVRLLIGHFDYVYCLAWRGDRLISGSKDGKLLVWNPDTTNKVMAIPLRSAYVMTVDIRKDGTQTAKGGLDNLVTVFNLSDDQLGWEVRAPHRELQLHEGYVSDVQFVRGGSQILSASGDSSVILWDTEKEAPLKVMDHHNGDVMSVDFCEHNGLFLSGAIDARIALCDLRMRKGRERVCSFEGHQSDVNDVRWVRDHRCFVSGSDDSSVHIFDIRCVRRLNKYTDSSVYGGVTSVTPSHSGAYIFAGYDESPYCLKWNTLTNVKSEIDHNRRVSEVTDAPDGSAIATSCWDRRIRIWS